MMCYPYGHTPIIRSHIMWHTGWFNDKIRVIKKSSAVYCIQIAAGCKLYVIDRAKIYGIVFFPNLFVAPFSCFLINGTLYFILITRTFVTFPQDQRSRTLHRIRVKSCVTIRDHVLSLTNNQNRINERAPATLRGHYHRLLTVCSLTCELSVTNV